MLLKAVKLQIRNVDILKIKLSNIFVYSLQGQCHEIFDHLFFCFKDSTWAPYEQAKRFRKLFRFCEDIRGKRVSTCVNDYADTSMTTRTLFANFEGFSQISKEQSGKKRYSGVFIYPTAIL